MTAITPVVVDLYHGDDVTDYGLVAANGIKGVIHKATEGDSDADPMYTYRRSHFADVGIALWGAYHFIRPGDPVEQADFFVRIAAPDANTLMALDHETQGVSLSDAIAFMQEVEKQVGRECVLYSGSLLKEQIAGATTAQVTYLQSRRLWLPEYGPKAICPACYGADGAWLWQYTGDGVGEEPHTVAGIKGNIDLNHYGGDDLAGEWAGVEIAAA